MIHRFTQVLPAFFALACVWDGPADSEPRAVPREALVGVTDQGENTTDLSITRRIRRAIMAADGLSFSAKNAKIITCDGRVTLQGEVETSERGVLLTAARNVAGAGRVDDQLRVAD